MICPICKEDKAFLWTEYGIPEPGKDIPVSIKCGGKCMARLGLNEIVDDPIEVATIRLDIIVKRGSLKLDDDI